MTKQRKLGLLGIFLLTIHFGFTFFYSAPYQLVGTQLPHWASHYNLPLFHQNWNLFAPEPPQWNYEVELIFQEEKYTQYLCHELLERHHAYRVGPSGRFSMVIQNLMATLHQLVEQQQPGVEQLKAHLHRLAKNLAETYYPERKLARIILWGRNKQTEEELRYDL